MGNVYNKIETRIIPETTDRKFLAQHLKPYEFIRPEVKGKKVVEIGCGDGYGSAYLAEVAAEVVGVDYAEDIIVEAARKYVRPNLKYSAMEASRLEFSDRTFDVACSFQVVEHIPQDQLDVYFQEIKRVLKRDGVFYLSTLNLAHAMKPGHAYQKHPAHVKEFYAHELRSLLESRFSDVKMCGLHLTLKHQIFLRLKKLALFSNLPERLDPVAGFYRCVSTGDFLINDQNIERATDFICCCRQ